MGDEVKEEVEKEIGEVEMEGEMGDEVEELIEEEVKE